MSGSFNPINMVSQIALGVATGGASLVAQLAMQVVSQVVQQVVQQVGQQLGLPQEIIDVAKNAATGAMGGGLAGAALGAAAGGAGGAAAAVEQLGQATGASPSEIGDAQRTTDDIATEMATSLTEGEEAKEAKAGGKGGSWLMAMARALGEKADQMATEMETMANNMKSENSKPSDSLEFGAKSQEFSLFMNAATNAIKTAGEGLVTGARKGG